jgi:hypothetical protein
MALSPRNNRKPHVPQWALSVGDLIKRTELHKKFGGGGQSGISPSAKTPNIFIFSDPASGEQHGYVDRSRGGVFHYTGHGQQGEQEMKRGNLAILKASNSGKALRVFEGAGGIVKYRGRFELDKRRPFYRTSASEKGRRRLRSVIVFRLRRLSDNQGAARGGQATRYWVVSPNVHDDREPVHLWKEASIATHAAFMGWGPNQRSPRQIGPKFAGKTSQGIQSGDRILIARRHNKKPDIVGFGVVRGKAVTRFRGLEGLSAPGSLRKLQPFLPWSLPPPNVPLIKAVRQTMALSQLHPDRDPAHLAVCEWMEEHLREAKLRRARQYLRHLTTPARVPLPIRVAIAAPQNRQLDYVRQTQADIKIAKAVESQLLYEYRLWLKRQDRTLSSAIYGRLRCDAYEKATRNLIEAKSASTREHIRMAVGQLRDYAFQGRQEFPNPNTAILLPNKPQPDILEWLATERIAVIWRKGKDFFDTAGGRFT